jgi:uncharacterized membrane protein YdbT with pleckstrin-like domain
MNNNSDVLDEGEELILEVRPSRKAFIVWDTLAFIFGLSGLLSLNIVTILIAAYIQAHIWFRLKLDDYKVTNERLITRKGFIWRNLEELELFRVKDVAVHQSVIGRIVGFGTIKIISTDVTTPTIKITGIENPIKVKEEIRKLYKVSRRKEKVVARELI